MYVCMYVPASIFVTWNGGATTIGQWFEWQGYAQIKLPPINLTHKCLSFFWGEIPKIRSTQQQNHKGYAMQKEWKKTEIYRCHKLGVERLHKIS
jgi:hypothetical protein